MLQIIGTNFSKIISPQYVKRLTSEKRKIIVAQLLSLTDEFFILETCNRVEIYYYSNKEGRLDGKLNLLFQYYYKGKTAFKHLCQVFSGLDSQIIGETQISGQVKFSIKEAVGKGYAKNKFMRLLSFLIKINREIRRETKIAYGSLSYSKIVGQILSQYDISFRQSIVVLVGTGKLAYEIVNFFDRKVKSLIVVSHKYKHNVKKLQNQFNIMLQDFSELKKIIPEADIIISAVSAPHLIFTESDFEKIKKNIYTFDLNPYGNIEKVKNKNVRQFYLDDIYNCIDKIQNKKYIEKTKALNLLNDIIETQYNIWLESDCNEISNRYSSESVGL